MTDAAQQCLQCNKPIKGRIDKKFCDDWCRNAFNNKRYSHQHNIVKNINHILKKNRQVIEKLIPHGKELTKISRKKLQESGFNFEYITHTYVTKKGVTYFFCYEYGYLPIEQNYCLLVRRNTNEDIS